jgi:3-keto-5-aminohexanoate cleavage enzyme
MREGLAGIVPCAAVSVGSCDTVHQAVEQLVLYTQSLPSNCAWWIMKGGQHYLRLRTAAMALGGHVRVGFEDTVYQCDGTLANSNAVFVDQMVRLAHATGRGVASTGQAREILNMTARN